MDKTLMVKLNKLLGLLGEHQKDLHVIAEEMAKRADYAAQNLHKTPQEHWDKLFEAQKNLSRVCAQLGEDIQKGYEVAMKLGESQ